MMVDEQFWYKKKVFVTGHTGFKGSWLCLWLRLLGADVTGYALLPPTKPSLFEQANINSLVRSFIGDVSDLEYLKDVMRQAQPDIVFHLAAQPLVRESYILPVETYLTNIMGTVHLLEAVRNCPGVKAVVNITTDKCYENKEWVWGYRETDQLGGYDPYSCSKACSELVTASYRSSYFNPKNYHEHGVAIASARAGNVIGGGDWAKDRLLPDCVQALLNNKKIHIRNPQAIRPWQHVLEPLCGYLQLAQKLYENGPQYGEGWNFGPEDNDARTVLWIVERICSKWGKNASYEIAQGDYSHEANYLKLDCSKAKTYLEWKPKWSLENALDKVIEWMIAYQNKMNMQRFCISQIQEYSNSEKGSYYGTIQGFGKTIA